MQLLSHETIIAFRSELRQNLRLRLGLWLIVFVLLFYWMTVLVDSEQAAKIEYQSNVEHLQQLEWMAGQNDWLNRAGEARASMVQLQSGLWHADSRGLAQAQIQIWVDNILKKMHIKDGRIQVEPAHDLTEFNGIWQVSVRIDAPFEPTRLVDLIKVIETHPEKIIIVGLRAALKPRPRFILSLKFYFQANN